MTTVDKAREYERAYHEALYASHELFKPGTWLHKPAGYAVDSFAIISKHDFVRALDLGSRVGRHSIPLAQYLGPQSGVVSVDLLASAVDKLKANAREHGVEQNITGIVSDIEALPWSDALFDFVLSVSCIEHIPTTERLETFIQQLKAHTTPGGIHCFMMITDNEWMNSANGTNLVPLTEQNLSSQETTAMIQRLYSKWTIHDLSTKAWEATQSIGGQDVILKSTCVQFTGQKS